MNHNSYAMFEYIASVNDAAVRNLLYSYGYNPENAYTPRDLSVYTEDLVANNGDKALVDLLNLHPDKEVILQVFTPDEDDDKECESNKGKKEHCEGDKNRFNSQNIMHLALLGSGVLVALALISKN